jgi:hypothetical protein
MKRAIDEDIVVVLDQQTANSLGSATFYRFRGDRSTEDIIRCMGGGISGYGVAFLSGMVSLFLSRYRQVHEAFPPAGKRQVVKDWLNGLARGNVGSNVGPWSICEETMSVADGYHLRAAIL